MQAVVPLKGLKQSYTSTNEENWTGCIGFLLILTAVAYSLYNHCIQAVISQRVFFYLVCQKNLLIRYREPNFSIGYACINYDDT